MTNQKICRRSLLRAAPLAALGVTAASGSAAGETVSKETANFGEFETGEEHKLTAESPEASDQMGSAVALSRDGKTAIIGARKKTVWPNKSAGAAYIFEYENESWQLQQKVSAEESSARAEFGKSVAMSDDGTRVVVGAPGERIEREDATGAAYVFEYTDDGWRQDEMMEARDNAGGDRFGSSVAVSGDGTTALIGAESDREPNGEKGGSAYVFRDSHIGWKQRRKIAAEDGKPYARFGSSVALSRDATVGLVSAETATSPNGYRSGAVYVFDAADGAWIQQTQLLAEDGEENDTFGNSIALSADGTTAIVGDYEDAESGANRAGTVYVFEGSLGNWSQTAQFTSEDLDKSDMVGFDVDIAEDGTSALVGARGDEHPNGDGAGSAYLFEKSEGVWSQKQKIAAVYGDDGDRFGWSVALSRYGETALIGAIGADHSNVSDAGAAYAYFEAETLSSYADSNTEKIEMSGLKTAMTDWADGEIDSPLLEDVVAAWKSSEQVS